MQTVKMKISVRREEVREMNPSKKKCQQKNKDLIQ